MELTIKENDNIPLLKILNKWIDAINEVENDEEIDYTETIEHINNDTFKMCFPKHRRGTRLEKY